MGKDYDHLIENDREWRKHILNKLDKIDDRVDKIDDKVVELRIKSAVTSSLVGFFSGGLSALLKDFIK